ncbi:toxin-antitoxin system, antitoxin component domain protein [Leptospira interrogans serovar Bataviae str. HAI135]|nr:toxin-antitoxin system, antitoxin component domain protein [Leptospira interrogans serovar Bataviae str. HAI135]
MLHNDPSSPIVWLTHAKSDLLLSKFYDSKEILLNQLCYHAQQSVEKSIKAILIQSKVNFKFTHNIKNLIESLPQEIEKPNFSKTYQYSPIMQSQLVTREITKKFF